MAGNTSYTIIPELKLIITYCNGRVYTPNHHFLISIYKPIASLGKIDAENFKDIKLYFDWMKFSEDEQKVINDAIFLMRSNSSD